MRSPTSAALSIQPATVYCASWYDVRWQEARPALEKLADELLIFRINVAEQTNVLPVATHLLRPDEQVRAARYYQEQHRTRFVTGRAALRNIAGSLIGVVPEKIDFRISEKGKLYLSYSNIYCTVSYADNWILLAFASAEIGIDVENVNMSFQYADIINNYFSNAEKKNINSAEIPALCFYRVWTRKEAIAKALGTGIDDDFPLLPALDGLHQLLPTQGVEPHSWQVRSFMVDAQHVAAVAYPMALSEAIPQFYHVSPLWWC